MSNLTPENIMKTSIISAFTLATALIWKDVITDTIKLVVPESSELFYRYLVAIFATIVVIISIYIFLKTESRAKYIFRRFRKRR